MFRDLSIETDLPRLYHLHDDHCYHCLGNAACLKDYFRFIPNGCDRSGRDGTVIKKDDDVEGVPNCARTSAALEDELHWVRMRIPRVSKESMFFLVRVFPAFPSIPVSKVDQ